MSGVKRGLALALTLAMILMTVSVTALQTGYAATDTDVRELSSTYSADGTSVNVTFWIKDETTTNVLPDHVSKNAVVTVETGDFTPTGASADYKVDEVRANSINKWAEYKVSLKNLKPKDSTKAGKLQIKVKDTKDNKPYEREINVDIPAKSTTPPATDPPKASESNAKYTVTMVRGTKQVTSNGSTYPEPNDDRKYFDIDNLTGGSDATIRQTYFADITLRVPDDKGPSPADITVENIVPGGKSMDMGSFYFDSRVSTIKVQNVMEGYYEVVLTGLRYSGNSNKLTFRTKTANYLGDVVAEISECYTKKDSDKDSNNTADKDDDDKLDVETPYVIVSKYSYGGGTVTAGDTFPLSMTFYNTSEVEVVSNMMITVTMPEGLMLTSSSNTFYVEELDKHASITKSVQVTAKTDAKVQSHNVVVAMKYQYVDDRANARRSAETTENIAVPVVQVDRFQVTGVEIPMEVMMGEETSVTVNYVNKGRSDVYNISLEIGGNIQNPGQNQNMGNLASGVVGTADFYILPNEVGMCTGDITITYEDTNMEEKKATIRYNTTVKSPEEFGGGMNGGMIIGGGGMGVMGGEEVPEEPKPMNIPLIAGICAAVVAIPVLVIVKKKLDKKRKEREDADL